MRRFGDAGHLTRPSGRLTRRHPASPRALPAGRPQ